jgi:hypothetical protein
VPHFSRFLREVGSSWSLVTDKEIAGSILLECLKSYLTLANMVCIIDMYHG